MSKKNKHKEFVDAVRMRGGAKYFDLGGGVDLGQAPSAAPIGTAPIAPPPNANNAWNFFQGAGATPNQLGVPTPSVPGGGQMMVPGILGTTGQTSYQAQLAPTTQLNYTPIANAGFNQAQGNMGNEQALEQQYMAQAAGQGPNPAQAALNQNTGANVANQAALMAGQRGASANAGLMGREIAQQGAATQQQAVGQGATLMAQQRLAAQQGAAQQQAQIGQQAGQQLNTGVAGNAAQNAGNVANYQQAQNVNAAIATGNTQASSQLGGGVLGGIGAIIGAMMAKGGEVPDKTPQPIPVIGYADGGGVGGPMSMAGQLLAGSFGGAGGVDALLNKPGSSGKGMFAPGPAGMAERGLLGMSKGGKTPVKGSELSKGKMVPGKAKTKGDSLKNDTVPAMLSPGEIVIPKSIAEHPDAANKAAQFVQATLAKSRGRKGK